MYTLARHPGLCDSFTLPPGSGLQHSNSRSQTINMRFSTIASLSISALSVFAQTSEDAFGWSVELIQGLTKVPDCAVRISDEYTAVQTEVPTRLTFTQANCLSATLPQSKCNKVDLNCLCEDEEYQKYTGYCITAVCSVKEALSELVYCPKPFAPANDPSQLPRPGRRKPARPLIEMRESQLGRSAQAWSLLAEAASYYVSSRDTNSRLAVSVGTTGPFSRHGYL